MNSPGEMTMTAEEARLIKAYRLSDAMGKLAVLGYAESMSEDWPELHASRAESEQATRG